MMPHALRRETERLKLRLGLRTKMGNCHVGSKGSRAPRKDSPRCAYERWCWVRAQGVRLSGTGAGLRSQGHFLRGMVRLSVRCKFGHPSMAGLKVAPAWRAINAPPLLIKVPRCLVSPSWGRESAPAIRWPIIWGNISTDHVIADPGLESPEIGSRMNSKRLSCSAVADSRCAPRTLVRSHRAPNT